MSDPLFPLLTTSEVCSLLQVSRQTLWRLIARGQLKCIKIGPRGNRFRKLDVEKLLKSKETKRRYATQQTTEEPDPDQQGG